MIRIGIWLGVAVLMSMASGCGSFQTLEDRAENALGMAVNPRCREITYLRNVDDVSYHREECAGGGCERMESCNE